MTAQVNIIKSKWLRSLFGPDSQKAAQWLVGPRVIHTAETSMWPDRPAPPVFGEPRRLCATIEGPSSSAAAILNYGIIPGDRQRNVARQIHWVKRASIGRCIR